MRRLVLVALIALVGLLPMSASAQAPAQAATAAKSDVIYPLVLAAGATAGIVALNWMTGPFSLPYSYRVLGGAHLASPAAQAASRIYVITAGVVGALVANTLYGK